jgi:uncharacterized membrane protein
MLSIIHSTTGLIHLISALIAMLTGAVVLLRPKGTTWHKRIGYVYVGSMLILNLSAFGIYHLTGSFGIFHGLALVSLGSLIGGMYPAIRRTKDWLEYHYEFMGWSVIGLYAAFFAETSVRFFIFEYFWIVATISSILTVAIGGFILKKKKEQLLTANG